jgi:hypothetical protein
MEVVTGYQEATKPDRAFMLLAEKSGPNVKGYIWRAKTNGRSVGLSTNIYEATRVQLGLNLAMDLAVLTIQFRAVCR